ncbi:MAG: Do family serine endopeptidase [Planctomycetota bacterium]|jgi:hypothetical protein
MLDMFEKIVWVLTIVVIIGLATGIYLAGGPSRHVLADLQQPTRISDPNYQKKMDQEITFNRQDALEAFKREKGEGAKLYRSGSRPGTKIPEKVIDEKTGLIKYVAPIHGAGTKTKTKYMVLDKRLKEKYSNFQDIYQIALLAESQFTEDENGLPVIEVTHVTRGSIIEQVGFRKSDVVYSICGYTVKDQNEAFKLYEELKNFDVYSVELVRGGQRMTMNFKFD